MRPDSIKDIIVNLMASAAVALGLLVSKRLFPGLDPDLLLVIAIVVPIVVLLIIHYFRTRGFFTSEPVILPMVFAIITLITFLVISVLVLPGPTPTLKPSPSATSSLTLTSTTQPPFIQPHGAISGIDNLGLAPLNWVAPFEKVFNTGFGLEGSHEYSITFSCDGGALSTSATRQFQVSFGAEQSPQPVYLTIRGLTDDPLLTSVTVFTTIHPSQVTIASVSRTHIGESQAETTAERCRASISWDGEPAESLNPSQPYPFLAVDPFPDPD